MQGIILAAGMGKRLKELTQNNTKCMVKVNGTTLIDRMLHQLDKINLEKIIIVVGYEGEQLINYIGTLGVKTPIFYIDNPIYDKTNNIYSLALAKEHLLQDDTILLESDLIFEDDVLNVLLDDPRETLALVDKYESWMDGTCITIGGDDTIDSFIPGKKLKFKDVEQYYKTVNIYKFSKRFSEKYYVPFLDAYSKALGNNEYYEQVLRVITMLDDPEIKAKKLNGERWYEIDDVQDLDIASSMFTPDDDDKIGKIEARYGGYWRYPHMLDFCYLVNPYFPTQRMMDEIKASFETLLTQYPSGMEVNCLLASKNFGVQKEHIVVGNGAAELIKCLMENTKGTIGVIRPTFEEYPNRYDVEKCITYTPNSEDFSYTADDLMVFYDGTKIETLLLINPDNPSGNYINKKDVLRLIQWSKDKNIRIVVDESFVDFAEESNNTLIDDDILNEYKNLVVVKSISKSYGVPGARLGVLASGDKNVISTMKKEVAIWNINSFGEFYMQIEEKYKNDYAIALEKIKNSRKLFMQEMSTIPGIRVIPSQANYFIAEITNGMTARALTKTLLVKYKILVKDLSKKIKRDKRQFIRVAVRNDEDNAKLINAFRELFSK